MERIANVLNVELKDFFEFAHKAKSPKKLKETLSSLPKEVDEEKLRMAVKIGKVCK